MTTPDTVALIAGHTFRVEDIAGRGTLDAAHPELTFEADGSVHGSATINRVSGAYSIHGDTLTVGPLVSTRMAGTPAAMDQEERLLKVLSRPLRVIAGDNGTVSLDDGDSLTRLVDVGGGTSDSVAELVVSGAVVYHQRIALPPDAVTTVRLLDVARADAPATVLAERVIEGGQVPIPFVLRAPRADLQPQMRLSVAARIEAAGQLLWISDTINAVEVDAGEIADLTVMVVQVGADAAPPVSDSPLRFSGSVVYHQRIALPPDAITTVTLEDVSIADGAARVLASTSVSGGQVPIPFELSLDPSAVTADSMVVVRARIEAGGGLIWTSDEAHVVYPTEGAPVTVVVVQVPE